MSIASEIMRIKTNIENAYTKAEEKGATIPEVKNSENLASCLESITVGGGGGASNEVARYQVVDGVAIRRTEDITGKFKGITSIGEEAFHYAYYEHDFLAGEASFSDLTTIDRKGMYNAFYYCVGLTSVDLSSLTSVAYQGLYAAFSNCSAITSLNLDSLTTVEQLGFSGTFRNCNGLTSINFKSLTTVGVRGLYQMFISCKGLISASFPVLTSVETDSLENTFSNCTAMTEIHFRVDMQSTIQGLTGYSSKFGATNATIYFDL